MTHPLPPNNLRLKDGWGGCVPASGEATGGTSEKAKYLVSLVRKHENAPNGCGGRSLSKPVRGGGLTFRTKYPN